MPKVGETPLKHSLSVCLFKVYIQKKKYTCYLHPHQSFSLINIDNGKKKHLISAKLAPPSYQINNALKFNCLDLKF